MCPMTMLGRGKAHNTITHAVPVAEGAEAHSSGRQSEDEDEAGYSSACDELFFDCDRTWEHADHVTQVCPH